MTPVASPFSMFDLSGRVALVTGASTGLGERFARVLHSAGATVVITGRRSEPLRDLGQQLGAEWIAADLATRDFTLNAIALLAAGLFLGATGSAVTLRRFLQV